MRKKIDVLILMAVLLFGAFAAFNARYIGDWVHFQRYSPPNEIEKIATGASMSNTGKNLFYRFSPQLLSETDLKTMCGNHSLGCTEGNNIFVLNYKSNREYNQSIVTSAHEMLHVAYSRLSEDEKVKLHALLDKELSNPLNNKLLDKIKGYPEDDYYNEAHSFVGTEILRINPELEIYYKEYFNNRSILIKFFSESPTI